jgi:acetyl-CoA carboxylase biotin carboxyl carrier protein
MTQKIEVEIGELRQITSWLAAGDVEFIEISKPGATIRLTMEQEPGAALDALLLPPAQGAHPAGTITATKPAPQRTTTVTARSVGVFLAAHPARATPLVDRGAHVRQGDIVGLLQIAQLCVPVVAPVDGTVSQLLAAHGATVGYGTPLLELE